MSEQLSGWLQPLEAALNRAQRNRDAMKSYYSNVDKRRAQMREVMRRRRLRLKGIK